MSDAEFKKLAKELAGKQRSSSSILLLIIVTLVLVVFVWASVTELDNVVRGSGKTVSEAQNQLVQSSRQCYSQTLRIRRRFCGNRATTFRHRSYRRQDTT